MTYGSCGESSPGGSLRDPKAKLGGPVCHVDQVDPSQDLAMGAQ